MRSIDLTQKKPWVWRQWEVIFENKQSTTSRLRVPGGFLYRYSETSPEGDISTSMVFAPFIQRDEE